MATAAEMNGIKGLAFDRTGNLYISDTRNHRVRRVTPAGIISTYAGNGEAGTNGDGALAVKAELDAPGALATDGAGNLYIMDEHAGGVGSVREVSRDGRIRLLPTGEDVCCGLAADATGYVYMSAADTNLQVERLTPNATRPIQLFPANLLDCPAGGTVDYPDNGAIGLAVDGAGNVFVAEPRCHIVRERTRAGKILTVAGNGKEGNTGDGGPATAATFTDPTALALDGLGNLFIFDEQNQNIRKVGTNGRIATVATGLGTWAIAIDQAGSLNVDWSEVDSRQVMRIPASH